MPIEPTESNEANESNESYVDDNTSGDEDLFTEMSVPGSVPVKAWINGVSFDDGARRQLMNIARMPIIHGHVAAMPDVHLGKGATIGSVIPTKGAIIPAAVGVDLGCGMMATRTSLMASDLPTNLADLRDNIEKAVPHGRSSGGRRSDRGAWGEHIPGRVGRVWKTLRDDFEKISTAHPAVEKCNHVVHLGTLGTGNHFIEVCLDEDERVWMMLHSGSRGVGNRIGSYFIEKARIEMREHIRNLPDRDLAYLKEGTESFDDYVFAVSWAQRFALENRKIMMASALEALKTTKGIKPFTLEKEAVNCHHNYISRESHGGDDVWLTRKGAVSARKGELGIIPGSMGAKSFIVSGKGNAESFHSCSHGAGRAMSRGEAKRRFTVEDHERATKGVECRKDQSVIDETPKAYKNIDKVMAAQRDLVDIVHTLRQVVCVKG